ncbi:MAG TPA: MmcQ/YjbR family DNA-binding protein [Gaiellaceae bacterium]
MAVSADEVCEFARTLPGINEGFVRGNVKFRIKRIVWLSVRPDGSRMGLAFPKYLREALVHSDPEKFSLPSEGDMRYHWVHVRLGEIDAQEMRELVEDAWAFCAPQSAIEEYRRTVSGRGASTS